MTPHANMKKVSIVGIKFCNIK